MAIDRVSTDDLMSLATDVGATPAQVGVVLLLDPSTEVTCDGLLATIERRALPRRRSSGGADAQLRMAVVTEPAQRSFAISATRLGRPQHTGRGSILEVTHDAHAQHSRRSPQRQRTARP